MLKSLRPIVAAAASIAAFAAMTTAASAAAPTGDYANFKYCPYTNPNVQSCLYSSSTSGSFKFGNATVPISAPIIFQGGYSLNVDDLSTTFYPAVGADTLVKTRLQVPGGLIGLVDTGGFSGLLISLFNAAVASVNNVTATAELAGAARFDYIGFLSESGPAVTLPVRIHLENPFLGSNCYIGSTSNPVTLKLTDGTTSPPAPNTPITGSTGTLVSNSDGGVLTATGAKLVDNAFSVPAASDCGYLPLDKLLITAGVNLREGLPSAAGRNSATLQGTTQVGSAANTAASVR